MSFSFAFESDDIGVETEPQDELPKTSEAARATGEAAEVLLPPKLHTLEELVSLTTYVHFVHVHSHAFYLDVLLHLN